MIAKTGNPSSPECFYQNIVRDTNQEKVVFSVLFLSLFFGCTCTVLCASDKCRFFVSTIPHNPATDPYLSLFPSPSPAAETVSEHGGWQRNSNRDLISTKSKNGSFMKAAVHLILLFGFISYHLSWKSIAKFDI